MKKQMRHKKLVVLGALMAAFFWMNAQPVIAQTEQCLAPQPTSCIPLNGGGSSAANQFMSEVPLDLLDQAPNLPIEYQNGTIGSVSAGSYTVWTGTRSGTPTIFRYAATASADGIVKLQQVMSNSLSNMTYLDHTNLTGCTLQSLQTRASDGKQYYLYTGCTATTSQPMAIGMADVFGSSFHQTGPIGTSVTPLDQSMLTSTVVVIVPWQLTVGGHVKKNIGTTSTPVLVPVVGFSRTEAEAIFSRQVTDWTQLGLVTDVNSPGTPDTTSPIYLCLRTAGSGSKAGLSVTVMKDATETVFPTSEVIFGASTGNVQSCLVTNSTGVGYLDANASVVGAAGTYYPVRLNGLLSYDTSLTPPTLNVQCGHYLYWAGEHENVRNYSDPGFTPAIQALASAFITDSENANTIALLPVGPYWVPLSKMFVFKNADPGPVNWSAGPHPSCAD